MNTSRGPHIGTCEDLLRGQREDWRDARYCGAPVMSMGLDYDRSRDVCQACRARTEARSRARTAAWAAALARDAREAHRWMAAAADLIEDDRRLVDAARWARLPLSEVRRRQRVVSMRVDMVVQLNAALLAAHPGLVPA